MDHSTSELIEWGGHTFIIKNSKELAYVNEHGESSVDEVIDRVREDFYIVGQSLPADFAEEYNRVLATALVEAADKYNEPLKELGEFAASYVLVQGQDRLL